MSGSSWSAAVITIASEVSLIVVTEEKVVCIVHNWQRISFAGGGLWTRGVDGIEWDGIGCIVSVRMAVKGYRAS